METIGKILSLTLLTIFGSAAATVYMVDSNFFPSFLEEAPSAYTSDVVDDYQADYETLSSYREEERQRYYQVSPSTKNDVEEDDQTVWGQNYSSTESSAPRISATSRRLAEEQSLGELRDNMRYWNKQYIQAMSDGENRRANKAYAKYTEFKDALELKRNSE